MTTAFTAIPEKITTSAMRFLGGTMTQIYPMPIGLAIDPDQVRSILVE